MAVGSNGFDRELALGVTASACMWAACWVLVTMRYATFSGDAKDVTTFVFCASAGQVLSLAICVLFPYRIVTFARSAAGRAVLVVVSASSFGLLLAGVACGLVVCAAMGVLFGAVLGILWVETALFLLGRGAGEVARCLAVGSLVGGAFLVCCLLFVPAAGAVFAGALVPVSLLLSGAPQRSRAGELSSWAEQLVSRRRLLFDELREYASLFVVIIAFGLVFGLQIGTSAANVQIPRVVVGASFLIPGIVLLLLNYGIKRSVNLRTLCLAILLCSVSALLPWLAGDGVVGIIRSIMIFVSFTLFDLSSVATLIELGAGSLALRAAPIILGRLAIMVAVSAGMALSVAVVGSDSARTVVSSVAILVLIAVFARFTLMREMLSPRASSAAPSKRERAASAIAKRMRLTSREKDVLLLLAKGYNVKRIAEELTLSVNTVKTHQSHVYSKLKVHTHQELIKFVEREVRDGEGS